MVKKYLKLVTQVEKANHRNNEAGFLLLAIWGTSGESWLEMVEGTRPLGVCCPSKLKTDGSGGSFSHLSGFQFSSAASSVNGPCVVGRGGVCVNFQHLCLLQERTRNIANTGNF